MERCIDGSKKFYFSIRKLHLIISSAGLYVGPGLQKMDKKMDQHLYYGNTNVKTTVKEKNDTRRDS